jgi:3-oxoacyl-[acyl-carrier protein] reductase
MRLKNKVAIVTGGAGGIGVDFCWGLANEGAKVVIADINIEPAKAELDEYKKSGMDVLAIKTDVTETDSTISMATETAERFGRIDILVNCAAMMRVMKMSRDLPFWELDLDEWDRVMAVNVKGALLCARAVFPYMKDLGKGKIINISSGNFYQGGGGVKYSHYVTSKGAVIGLTRAMAREAGDYNINVNCIAPGYVATYWVQDQYRIEFGKTENARRCIKRDLHAKDLVGTLIYLASADSDLLSGQTILVDGGLVML